MSEMKKYKYYLFSGVGKPMSPHTITKGTLLKIEGDGSFYQLCKIYENENGSLSFRAKKILRFYKNGKRKYERVK